VVDPKENISLFIEILDNLVNQGYLARTTKDSFTLSKVNGLTIASVMYHNFFFDKVVKPPVS
jgi:hypothetical protein